MREKYHFIGIGGIGMSGLAHLLLEKNIAVSGSDIAISPVVESLIKSGAVVCKGHAAKNISEEMIVVYTSDIKPDNPEYAAAVEKRCRIMHRSDLLAKLMEGSKSLAVAGTHGKTTTSALLSTVLVDAGCDPSFAVGGILPQFQSNSRFGQGDYFAFEADESDQSFLKYHPFGAIVTNIDHDHLVNYENHFENLVEAFQTFMNQVQSASHLVWCGDDPHLKVLHLPGHSYGFGAHCDWKVFNLRQDGFRSTFDLQSPQGYFKEIESALIGEHNALNAAGVFVLAFLSGIKESSIRQSFRTFPGVLRRCEKKGAINGILFLDDYAHHPAEIKTTLNGIRRAIGGKRLVAVFQPHRYTRTQECLGMFGACFQAADAVIVTDIYGAGENPVMALSGEKVMQEIKAKLPACQYVPRSALTHQLSQFVEAEDVVVTLGAGDITKVGNETLILLQRK